MKIFIKDININYDNKVLMLLRSDLCLISTILVMIIGVSYVVHIRDIQDYMLLNLLVLPCFIVLLFKLGYHKMPRYKSFIIAYLSKLSYAFFLVHFFCWKFGKWFVSIIGYDQNWIRIILTFLFCIVSSTILYEVVQKPIVKLVNSKLIK